MAKSMQLMKVLLPYIGTYVVTYHEGKVNPFVMTLKAGGHQTKVIAYADYGSCWVHIKQIMEETNNFGREDMRDRRRQRLPESL